MRCLRERGGLRFFYGKITVKCVTHRHVIENYSLFHGHHSSILLNRTLRKKNKCVQPIWPLAISWCFHAVTLAYWWRLFILSLLCRGSRPSKNIGVSSNLALLDANFFQHICALTTYKVPEMSVWNDQVWSKKVLKKISNCTRVKETSTGRRSKRRCRRRPFKCSTLFWPAISQMLIWPLKVYPK